MPPDLDQTIRLFGSTLCSHVSGYEMLLALISLICQQAGFPLFLYAYSFFFILLIFLLCSSFLPSAMQSTFETGPESRPSGMDIMEACLESVLILELGS